MMAVDGTTAVLDAIHALAFTKTGGVGNTWPGDSSNFRTLLGAQAPVIAQACDNRLSDQDASFEAAGVGSWVDLVHSILTNVTTWAYHGYRCLKLSSSDGGPFQSGIEISGITEASHQYEISLKFKATAGSTYTFRFMEDGVARPDARTIVATGAVQTAAVIVTFSTGGARTFQIICNDAVALPIYVDAVQIEAGAVQTPFCLHDPLHRHACTMTIPTATIGLTAAPLSLAFVVNEPWAGNDGVLHTLYDDDAISIYKTAANALTFEVKDVGAAVKTMAGAVTAANMAANTTHFIVATLTGGVLTLKLNNVALTTGAGAGTGIPTNFNALEYFGTDTAGANFWNGALLGVGWGKALSVAEQTTFAGLATWASVIDLPQITVTGLATGNAVRLYDAAGNVHASAVEAGGTATLTYALD